MVGRGQSRRLTGSLNVWVDKVGAHAVEFPILDLNQELMRDLIDRPFDR
jgi:hypothetical protein